MRPQAEDIAQVIRQALSRYEQGLERYGQLDLSSDPRDFLLEAEAELTDCINCVFLILKLRSLQRP